MTDSKTWYVQRSGQVRGPFSYLILTKLARLGRLKETDELSNNRESWSPASDFPELFKESDADLLLKDEERSGWDRREEEPSPDDSTEAEKKRQDKDRRQPESEEEVSRRRGRTRLLEAIKESREEDHFPFLAIIVSLVLIVMLGFALKPSGEDLLPDCDEPAHPKVNWDNCTFEKLILKKQNLLRASIRNAELIKANLQGAILLESNLSYSNLSNSNLKNAQLDKAILKGANLQSANLTSASLKGADLSYADLRGAKIDNADLSQANLEKAIWVDGKLCIEGSIGKCLKQ